MILWYRHLQEVCVNSFSCEGPRIQTILKWIHLVVYYLSTAREKNYGKNITCCTSNIGAKDMFWKFIVEIIEYWSNSIGLEM